MNVRLPDGRTAAFPDDMPHEQIEQVLRKQFPPSSVDQPEGFNWGFPRRTEGSPRPQTFGGNLGQLTGGLAADIGEGPAAGVSSIKAAGRDILEGGSEFLADLFKSLLPTRGGAEAGGRVLGKLGDIGTFLSGGLTSPLGQGAAMQPPGRGIQPIDRLTPQAPLALPPARPQLQLPPPGAGVTPPMMNVQPLGLPAPRLALPPPQTTGVPGRSWVTTGQGMLPGAPGGTMRPPLEQPPVGPGQAPQMVRMPPPLQPAPAAPVALPGAPAVPQYPGVVYHGRQAQVPPPEGAAKPGAPLEEAIKDPPSPLATALASGDVAAVDRHLTKQFRQAIRPGFADRRAWEGMNIQDAKITGAVDNIIQNRGALHLVDEYDRPLPEDRLPRTLREFSQAIFEQKTNLFQQYNDIAARVGGAGIQISLMPVVTKLRELATRSDIILDHPELVPYLNDKAMRYAQKGTLTPIEAQNNLRTMNNELAKTIKDPSKSAMRDYADNQVRDVLLYTLNTAIANAKEPQYQALRLQHGNLTSIESAVADAVKTQLARPKQSAFGKLTDVGAVGALVGGVWSGEWRLTAGALGAEAMKQFQRYWYSPNRAVTKLFQDRARTLDRPGPGFGAQMQARGSQAAGEMRQRTYDWRRGMDALGTTPPP